MERAAIPWEGLDSSVLSVMCKSASKHLPGELVQPFETIQGILEGKEGSSTVHDRPVAVSRWITTRTMKDKGGKFLVSIWRPMVED